MNHWNWRECPYLLSNLSYNAREHRTSLPHDEPEYCFHYAGCSLSLMSPPNDSCNYPTCYGKDNSIECGAHRRLRLHAGGKTVGLRRAKPPVTQLYDEDLLTEEEDLPLDDVDATLDEDDTLGDTDTDEVDKVA